MNHEHAVEELRRDSGNDELLRDSYLEADAEGAARRFQASAEFAAVRGLLGAALEGGEILELGAGSGFASLAMVQAGADRVYALEPDPSDIVGRGAIERLGEAGIEALDGGGESVPLPDGSVDAVYGRAVLHHLPDLDATMREVARVLRPGGVFLACREHVADDDEQLAAFLRDHRFHQITGEENAFPVDRYVSAISGAGLRVSRVLGPTETIINAFPAVRTAAELDALPRTMLERRLGAVGRAAAGVPWVQALVRLRLRRQRPPGRLYTFVACKGPNAERTASPKRRPPTSSV